MRTPTPSSLTLLALLATAAFVGPTSAQPNLLVNPGFETAGGSYTGWFTFGSGVQMSTPATDNIFRSGTAASKTFGGFVGCPNTPAFNVGGYGQALTPTGGLPLRTARLVLHLEYGCDHRHQHLRQQSHAGQDRVLQRALGRQRDRLQ